MPIPFLQVAACTANAAKAVAAHRKYPQMVKTVLMKQNKAAPENVTAKYPQVKLLGDIASWHKRGIKLRHPKALIEFLGWYNNLELC